MGTMIGKKTAPLSREAIASIDTLLAKCLLVMELCQIPVFIDLWQRARQIPAQVVETVRPRLEEIFEGLSPEGRAALVAGEKAYSLYGETAIKEAKVTAIKLQLICRATGDILEKAGIHADYRSSLEALVEPLGVPDLIDVMMIFDMKEWGLDKLLCGPVAGPFPDLLETVLIREITDLDPTEATLETPGRIHGRIRRKIAPLSRHLKRYALEQRIDLWARNVVLGEPIARIADELQRDEGREGIGAEPGEWVKKQIREATRILRAKRQPGRPRKGGVLRQWKMMAD